MKLQMSNNYLKHSQAASTSAPFTFAMGHWEQFFQQSSNRKITINFAVQTAAEQVDNNSKNKLVSQRRRKTQFDEQQFNCIGSLAGLNRLRLHRPMANGQSFSNIIKRRNQSVTFSYKRYKYLNSDDKCTLCLLQCQWKMKSILMETWKEIFLEHNFNNAFIANLYQYATWEEWT